MTSETAIILAHGAGQGMNSPFMSYFHSELAKRGFHSVKFNFEYMDAKRRVPDPQPKLRARYRSIIENVIRSSSQNGSSLAENPWVGELPPMSLPISRKFWD